MKRSIVLCMFLLVALSSFAEEKRFAIPVAGSPTTGPADAPVTIVEFLDFQ